MGPCLLTASLAKALYAAVQSFGRKYRVSIRVDSVQ